MHGLGASQSDVRYIAEAIEEMYPGIYVNKLNVDPGLQSELKSLSQQTEDVAIAIANDPNLQNGFNFIAHSQGGIIARAYVELYSGQDNYPQVFRLITLAGVNAGFYCGKESKCPNLMIEMIAQIADDIAYTDVLQNNLAPANYWRSPYEVEKYIEYSDILPVIDNMREYNQTLYDRLSSLQYFVCVGSSSDGLVTPWQSELFGFFMDGTDATVQDLEETSLYQDDLIGLKSLDEQGKLKLIEAPDYSHNDYLQKLKQDWLKENVYIYLEDE